MSFITSQQANIQGCKIETPHSDDISTICGTSMCAEVGVLNLSALSSYLNAQGWSSTATASSLKVNGQTETASFLRACDYSTVTPAPLRHDLCEGMKQQGFCSGDCT